MTEDFLASSIELCGDMIYRVALCRLQSVADAEDVFQDTFLRLCQQKRAAAWEDEHLKAWLLKVAINLCNDLGRKRQRQSPLNLENLPDLICGGMEAGLEIWEAASHLPEKQRLVFHLYYGEDYQTREISRILGMSETAVRVNLNRARSTLRKELKSSEEV